MWGLQIAISLPTDRALFSCSKSSIKVPLHLPAKHPAWTSSFFLIQDEWGYINFLITVGFLVSRKSTLLFIIFHFVVSNLSLFGGKELLFFFDSALLCSSGWPQIVAIFLLLSPECWGYKCIPPFQAEISSFKKKCFITSPFLRRNSLKHVFLFSL